MNKCKALKKIDLSWCGNDLEDMEVFQSHLIACLSRNTHTLTHISFGNCKYIHREVVEELSYCGELVGNL